MLFAMSPLVSAIVLCAFFAVLCWAISIATGNYSQVDRFWSIAPPIYVGWFAAQARFADARLDLMLALAALWGARLTYNFARKGGYRRGSEDYRWPKLRERLGPARFQLFNATFIAPFQNALLLLIALPAWVALEHRAPLGRLDVAIAAAFVALLAGETIADEQQWRFQEAKRERRARGEDGAEFLTTGLFRWSRHPNFFCEQAMWWTFYLFSVSSGGDWLNPSLSGPVLLTLLFQGSTAFTERMSLAKYPAYAEYQRTTSRLWPWPPRRSR